MLKNIVRAVLGQKIDAEPVEHCLPPGYVRDVPNPVGYGSAYGWSSQIPPLTQEQYESVMGDGTFNKEKNWVVEYNNGYESDKIYLRFNGGTSYAWTDLDNATYLTEEEAKEEARKHGGHAIEIKNDKIWVIQHTSHVGHKKYYYSKSPASYGSGEWRNDFQHASFYTKEEAKKEIGRYYATWGTYNTIISIRVDMVTPNTVDVNGKPLDKPEVEKNWVITWNFKGTPVYFGFPTYGGSSSEHAWPWGNLDNATYLTEEEAKENARKHGGIPIDMKKDKKEWVVKSSHLNYPYYCIEPSIGYPYRWSGKIEDAVEITAKEADELVKVLNEKDKYYVDKGDTIYSKERKPNTKPSGYFHTPNNTTPSSFTIKPNDKVRVSKQFLAFAEYPDVPYIVLKIDIHFAKLIGKETLICPTHCLTPYKADKQDEQRYIIKNTSNKSYYINGNSWGSEIKQASFLTKVAADKIVSDLLVANAEYQKQHLLPGINYDIIYYPKLLATNKN